MGSSVTARPERTSGSPVEFWIVQSLAAGALAYWGPYETHDEATAHPFAHWPATVVAVPSPHESEEA